MQINATLVNATQILLLLMKLMVKHDLPALKKIRLKHEKKVKMCQLMTRF